MQNRLSSFRIMVCVAIGAVVGVIATYPINAFASHVLQIRIWATAAVGGLMGLMFARFGFWHTVFFFNDVEVEKEETVRSESQDENNPTQRFS